jgi:predicted MFS family arabinose efflux permease
MVLPAREMKANMRYSQMLASMARLVRSTPELRRRALYHACMFGSFSLFWTTTPLLLAGPEFGMTHKGISLFALAGVAGAIAAPIVGRIADDWIRPATAIAMLMGITAFAITHIFSLGSSVSLTMFVLAGIILDFAVSANLVLGQRVIFALSPEFRSRLNGLYMATFFCGGAVGSALGAWVYTYHGWSGASTAGIAFLVVALVYFMTERNKRNSR